MINTFDRILDESFQNEIETIFTDHWFPWYFNKSANLDQLIQENSTSASKEYPQLTHVFFNDQSANSSFFDLAFKILDEFCQHRNLEVEKLYRIKSNLILKDSEYPQGFYSTPHVDVDEKHMTLIYYVCDSDGDTYIFNETEKSSSYSIQSQTSPKKGRFVYFDGSLYHAGSPPRTNSHRILINYNFCAKPKL